MEPKEVNRQELYDLATRLYVKRYPYPVKGNYQTECISDAEEFIRTLDEYLAKRTHEKIERHKQELAALADERATEEKSQRESLMQQARDAYVRYIAARERALRVSVLPFEEIEEIDAQSIPALKSVLTTCILDIANKRINIHTLKGVKASTRYYIAGVLGAVMSRKVSTEKFIEDWMKRQTAAWF